MSCDIQSVIIMNLVVVLSVGIKRVDCNSFLISPPNKSCWCSLEVPHQGLSNKYSQDMFLWRNNIKYPYIFVEKKKCLICSYGQRNFIEIACKKRA